jgi:hypothetical protein
MSNTKTVPNQKVIKIPNRIIKNELIFDIVTLDNAARLNANSFKLWIYLYKKPQNIDIALSSKDFTDWSGVGIAAYNNAVANLIELGYLVPTTRKNYFVFVDNPQLYTINDYIELNNQEKTGSKGEQKIVELLTLNKIPFIREATFGTCLFNDTGYPARFDFYVNNNYLIEFDGEQHFNPYNGYWKMDKNWFEKMQEHDEYKNQWCKDNNIPLIRIPYTKLDTLCIEDLMLETTQFKIV